MNRRVLQMGMALVLAGAVAACSALDMGPEPSDYVGPRGGGAESLTDADLQAVKPQVSGDNAGAADTLLTATMPGGSAVVPATLPGATRPASTLPATQPGANETVNTQPALGKVEVPRALTVQEAILIGLQNNSSLRVQRYNVPITRTNEEIARGAFDPTISGTISGGRSAVPFSVSPFIPGTTYTDQINAQIAAQEFLPTGTTISTAYTTNNSFYSDAFSSSAATLTVTQSLLKGAGLDVNLAALRQAEIDTQVSQYELRGFAESLVAQIEQTYWNLMFAEQQMVIVQNALDVAQQELDQTNELIRVQRTAESERAAAEAQVALRKEDLINAKSTLETTQLQLLQLITPPGKPFWDRGLVLHTLPVVPAGKMDPVDKHVDVALRLRPDVNQAKLEIQRGDLQVVRTKNGLLPQLDLFVTLGQTGYSKSFGSSITGLNGPDYNAIVGVTGSYTLENRVARGAYRAAVLTREQTEESLNNLEQTVQVDVRSQYIEVERTRQQIDATKATRIAQDTAYKVEKEKFAVGKSTSLLVAQAQSNLLAAQLAEVQALTGHLNALVALYRLEGSLLYRRGIEAPGGQPVKPESWRK